ncbi:hypothetical protein EAW52_24715 [Pseudomonas sp. LTJR-52]|uniref:hypothetical protein n=1 Tax=Pseudomonas sp. LTJR-52 TaxID=2479392 RepID=UPI000EFBA6DF|nr:hypothetical protein [Pseudomonas sp. LTJR-52]AYN96906.1 hypothetical protein EAW52_24715 [Pseudomonas sp. LTJR-52]
MNTSNYYTLNPEVNLLVLKHGFRRRFRAIRSLNKHLHHWGLLEIDWPCTIPYLESIYQHVGEGILHQNRPVIWSVTDKTMSEYAEAIANKHGDGKLDDFYRFAIIINTIISSTVKLLNITLSDNSGHSWNLLSEKTACEVLNTDDQLTTTPLTPDQIIEARRHLLNLLHERYRGILTDTNYENPIVTGTLPRLY